jgi:hypothetical protein
MLGAVYLMVMASMLCVLPDEIQNAIATLIPVLVAAHMAPVEYQCSEPAFGNFVVTFRSERREITLTRDRGQFMVSGSDRNSLESAGLWRAFDTPQDLLPHLSSWLGQSPFLVRK